MRILGKGAFRILLYQIDAYIIREFCPWTIPYLREDGWSQFRAKEDISRFSTFKGLVITNCRAKELLEFDLILGGQESEADYKSVGSRS